jgi:hypothetical protein
VLILANKEYISLNRQPNHTVLYLNQWFWSHFFQHSLISLILLNKMADISLLFVLFISIFLKTVSSQVNTDLSVSSLPSARGYVNYAHTQDNSAGKSVKIIGDINGDGINDYVIGAENAAALARGTETGLAYVIYGSSTFNTNRDLDSMPFSEGFTIAGTTAYDDAGHSFSSVDINKDGFADLIVGVPGGTPSKNKGHAGMVYVVYGKATRTSNVDLKSLSTTDGFAIAGMTMNDRAGTSVAVIGDINGDGFQDIGIGASYASRNSVSGCGVTFVIYGAASFPSILDLATLTSTQGFQLISSYTNGFFGNTISKAGDFNKDGVDDFIIGAHKDGNLPQGRAYIILGNKNTPFPLTINMNAFPVTHGLIIVTSATKNDQFGYSVAYAGDFNGDGNGDIIIGANYFDPSKATTNAGAAFVLYGSASNTAGSTIVVNTMTSSQGVALYPGLTLYHIGDSVSGGGDIDKDGYDDVVVGGTQLPQSGSPTGMAYVIRGGPNVPTIWGGSSWQSSYGFVISGVNGLSQLGYSVDNSGDINGDGVADILVTAPGTTYNGVTNSGVTYVIFGTIMPKPTRSPTQKPSSHPSSAPSTRPSDKPSIKPSTCPSSVPTSIPTTSHPSSKPSDSPVAVPSTIPSSFPSTFPSSHPSDTPTIIPTAEPTSVPTWIPTGSPTSVPSSSPTSAPSVVPTSKPSVVPSSVPSSSPTSVPSNTPTSQPTTAKPSSVPTNVPNSRPTSVPNASPTSIPSTKPTQISASPTTIVPTTSPSAIPSIQPSINTKNQVTFVMSLNISHIESNVLSSGGAIALQLAFQEVTGLPISNIKYVGTISSKPDITRRRRLENLRQLQSDESIEAISTYTLKLQLQFFIDISTNPDFLFNYDGLCSKYKTILSTKVSNGDYITILKKYALQVFATELYHIIIPSTSETRMISFSNCDFIDKDTPTTDTNSNGAATSQKLSYSIVAIIVVFAVFFLILLISCIYFSIIYQRKVQEQSVLMSPERRRNDGPYNGLDFSGSELGELEMGDNTVMMFMSSAEDSTDDGSIDVGFRGKYNTLGSSSNDDLDIEFLSIGLPNEEGTTLAV